MSSNSTLAENEVPLSRCAQIRVSEAAVLAKRHGIETADLGAEYGDSRWAAARGVSLNESGQVSNEAENSENVLAYAADEAGAIIKAATVIQQRIGK